MRIDILYLYKNTQLWWQHRITMILAGGEEKEMSNLGPDYKQQEEDAFKAAEDFKVEKSNLNLEENSAVNDMDKTLEKKDLKEKKEIVKTYTKEQVIEMSKEYKSLVDKEQAASQGSGDHLTRSELFRMKFLKLTLDEIGVETRYGEIEGTGEEFNKAIEEYNKRVGGTGVKEAPKYGDVGGLIEVESNVENKDLDLSLNTVGGETDTTGNNDANLLSQVLETPSTNNGQVVTAPSNTPNTTDTTVKITKIPVPFLNSISNQYLSITGEKVPPEFYRQYA